MTNGFDLNGLYNAIIDDLWADAAASTRSILEAVFLYEAMQDDLEDQAVTMMTGAARYAITPSHDRKETTETRPNNPATKT
jgi:hypothetical protein